MNLWVNFQIANAQLPIPPMDPMRFSAEAFKYSQDYTRVAPPVVEMPGNYSDRNVESTGAVTAS